MNEKNEEYIEKVLNEISDEKIEKAVLYSKEKKSFVFKLALAAAAFAVVVLGTFVLLNSKTLNKDPSSTYNPAVCQTSAAINTEVGEKEWENLPFNQKYDEVSFENHAGYCLTAQTINDKSTTFYCLGEAVGQNGSTPKKQEVEIYSIGSFSVNFTVAAKEKGESGFYVFVNDAYTPKTVGELLTDTDFENEAVCTAVLSSPESDGENSFFYSLTESEEKENKSEIAAAFLEVLKKNKSKRGTSVSKDDSEKYLALSFDSKSFSSPLPSFYVYPSGYIRVTNVYGASDVFFKLSQKDAERIFSLFDGYEKAKHFETTTSPIGDETEPPVTYPASAPGGTDSLTTQSVQATTCTPDVIEFSTSQASSNAYGGKIPVD